MGVWPQASLLPRFFQGLGLSHCRGPRSVQWRVHETVFFGGFRVEVSPGCVSPSAAACPPLSFRSLHPLPSQGRATRWYECYLQTGEEARHHNKGPFAIVVILSDQTLCARTPKRAAGSSCGWRRRKRYGKCEGRLIRAGARDYLCQPHRGGACKGA